MACSHKSKIKNNKKTTKAFFSTGFYSGIDHTLFAQKLCLPQLFLFLLKKFIRVLKILFIFLLSFYSLVFFFNTFFVWGRYSIFCSQAFGFFDCVCFLLLYYSVCLFWTFSLFFPPFPKQQRKKKKRKKIQTGKVQSCVFQRLRKHWWMMHRPLLPGFTTIFYLSKILIPNPFRVCFWSLFLVAFCFWWHVSKSKNENKATLFQDPKKTLTYSFCLLSVFLQNTLFLHFCCSNCGF